MRPLTKTELLHVWEKGIEQDFIERALHLLSISCSVPDTSVIARLTIGERDARLLKLREWMFGSLLKNIAHCPSCSQLIEWEDNISNLSLQTLQAETVFEVVRAFKMEADGYHILFRLPNSEDIARARLNSVYQSNPKKLLSECILEVQSGNKDYAIIDLPDNVFEILNQQMAKEDPQANISMLLSCPSCTYKWETPFDIMSYLWTEIENWARHLLREVYILARAFSWPERDIINMSAYRRQLYIEMIRS